MKVCFDTNVIIDILGKTEDFSYSFAALDISLLRAFEVFVSITSTTDLVYILPRRNLTSHEQAKEHLMHLLEIVSFLEVRSVDVVNALHSNMSDYEDALLASAAYRNGIDLIVTRNTKGYEHSPVPVISPQQFVDLYKPENVEYANASLEDID
jgi:predicted nucleic acid-binding protein